MRLRSLDPSGGLRGAIRAAHRLPETECVPELLQRAGPSCSPPAAQLARHLVQNLRRKHGGAIQDLIHEFSLSSQEGVALMCLAEALLRIPDRAMRNTLIREKIGTGGWEAHLGGSQSIFANAAIWGLVLTGRLLDRRQGGSLSQALVRLIGAGGEPLIQRAVGIAVGLMGEQFVAGKTIQQALARAMDNEARGFRHSYDMLGEAALTAKDAQHYYDDYVAAIHAIGATVGGRGVYQEPGISIKLSALHPRYCRAQRARVQAELLPRLVSLAALARRYGMGMNIDAEEADRLDLSLDLLEALCMDDSLANWDGVGFVVQAYQKRAPFVVDYLADLARRSGRRLMVRLVKGAYWDNEIKKAQVEGMPGYPVYTRKIYTDVCYIACARRLLAAADAVYPQFATHNALTLATVYYLAEDLGRGPGQYEFQCLHGMGESLYEEVVGSVAQGKLGLPCRIYAPVGPHDRLLAYLVRRLLENGANSSFVHQISRNDVAIESLLRDPAEQALALQPLGRAHDNIALPAQLYSPERLNSQGMDLADESCIEALSAALADGAAVSWQAGPMLLHGPAWDERRALPALNPADRRDTVGSVVQATEQEAQQAVAWAQEAARGWREVPVEERARCLLNAADTLEKDRLRLISLIVREAGKALPAAVAEVREAVDFLRYYAAQARDLSKRSQPLGPVVCISPWNFPLAIFVGQIAAGLAAGNTVLAKPAEQTSLIAAQAVAVLHGAGVPADVLQLLPGDGERLGAALVADARVQGVVFTGSVAVAKEIARVLAQRLNNGGRVVPLIAETGGINAMVVDSSALPEQAVADILVSAFDSAGQRCSALRLLCVQEDGADKLLEMLGGALKELQVGLPCRLDTDVGPLIDQAAWTAVNRHIEGMRFAGFRVEQLAPGADYRHGTFAAPTLIEINAVADLDKEVFGPVLHILRYKREELDDIIDAINAKGYGLTFGVHSRLNDVGADLAGRIAAGNVYVNRNMVGAVVGVQPFGGEGMSGTGPKAGGPLYLPRLVTQAQPDPQVWGSGFGQEGSELLLPGPVGESNVYRLMPRGTVLCLARTELGAQAQLAACLAAGNRALFVRNEASAALAAFTPSGQRDSIELAPEDVLYRPQAYQAVLCEGDAAAVIRCHQVVAALDGPIVAFQGLSSEALQRGERYEPRLLARERSISVNTAAVGGNANLLAMD
ncbi:Bifunctional protein PutA OS=Eoetvoesiella caeni OX=645616 GN=DFR37_103212 PE=3 SV=1 [Eoetvoesiella caeni]